jgi:PAT family beta-lactamase induction signal transducer AmpG
MANSKLKQPFMLHPVFWVSSLYLAMGIPYNVINNTALRMYKSLGYTNGQITFAIGSIGLAWSLKPLWAAFLDMYRTKKFFVLSMELLCGLLFAAVAMTLPLGGFFQISIAILWIAAFASSTQDICADGIYLTALDKPTQSRLCGFQSMFWTLGKVFAAGVLIAVLDRMRAANGWSDQHMWQMVMLACGASMIVLLAYHVFYLPTGSVSERPENARQVVGSFLGTAVTFFHKRAFWGMIAFVLLYRLGEGLIMQEGQLFLQSAQGSGGLGLTAGQVSTIDAVYGTVAFIIGGLLGGWFIGRMTLARCLWILGLSLNIPHFTFVFLSHYAAAGHGLSYGITVTMVSIEKFGYGVGMVGNMIYMMQQLAPGRSTMTHYAFANSLMNLVLVPTAMISGPLADRLGFSTFFFVVMFASIPSVLAAWRAPFPLKDDESQAMAGSTDIMVTVDDPSRLTAGERTTQTLAGRASIFAMFNILVILVVDMNLINYLIEVTTSKPEDWGYLSRLLTRLSDGHAATAFYALLVASAAGKVFLTMRAFQLAGQTIRIGNEQGAVTYLGNARGAKIVSLICAAATVTVLVIGARIAF